MGLSDMPVTVTVLTKHFDDESALARTLPKFRDLRLFALQSDPFGYSSTYADEAQLLVSQWKSRLLRPSVFHIVAERSSSISRLISEATDDADEWIGMAVARRIEAESSDDEKYVINALFVHPSARGKGIGRQLVDKCFEVIRVDSASRAQQPARVEIEVDSENAAAFALYKSVGFTVDGEQGGDVTGLVRRELSMSRSLAVEQSQI